MWFLALILRLYPFGIWFAIFVTIGKVPAIFLLLVVVWLMAPEIWFRAFVRRLAPPRVVYWLRRYSTFFEAIMPTGLSTLHAAIAATRKPNSRTLDWLGTKLSRMRYPRGAARRSSPPVCWLRCVATVTAPAA